MATSPPLDPKAFRAFEHAGWQGIASQYDQDFRRLTSQTTEPLLDAVGAASGVRVLDVATGPGYIAGAAAARGAKAMGVDFSAAMVEVARRNHPTADFREGDAEALPFPDESFDAVVMNFGLLHFGQPEQAVREAHRVLRPGGRFGFTVWANPEESVGFGIVLRAIHAHGNLDVPLPPGPPFFRFSDPAECTQVLRAAGFEKPSVVQIPLIWRINAPEAMFEALQGSTVRTGALIRAQTPEALSAIRAEVVAAVSAYRRGDLIEIPMSAVLASAVKG